MDNANHAKGFSLVWLLVLFFLAVIANAMVKKGSRLEPFVRVARYIGWLALFCMVAGVALALGLFGVARMTGIELAVSSALCWSIITAVVDSLQTYGTNDLG